MIPPRQTLKKINTSICMTEELPLQSTEHRAMDIEYEAPKMPSSCRGEWFLFFCHQSTISTTVPRSFFHSVLRGAA